MLAMTVEAPRTKERQDESTQEVLDPAIPIEEIRARFADEIAMLLNLDKTPEKKVALQFLFRYLGDHGISSAQISEAHGNKIAVVTVEKQIEEAKKPSQAALWETFASQAQRLAEFKGRYTKELAALAGIGRNRQGLFFRYLVTQDNTREQIAQAFSLEAKVVDQKIRSARVLNAAVEWKAFLRKLHLPLSQRRKILDTEVRELLLQSDPPVSEGRIGGIVGKNTEVTRRAIVRVDVQPTHTFTPLATDAVGRDYNVPFRRVWRHLRRLKKTHPTHFYFEGKGKTILVDNAGRKLLSDSLEKVSSTPGYAFVDSLSLAEKYELGQSTVIKHLRRIANASTAVVKRGDWYTASAEGMNNIESDLAKLLKKEGFATIDITNLCEELGISDSLLYTVIQDACAMHPELIYRGKRGEYYANSEGIEAIRTTRANQLSAIEAKKKPKREKRKAPVLAPKDAIATAEAEARTTIDTLRSQFRKQLTVEEQKVLDMLWNGVPPQDIQEACGLKRSEYNILVTNARILYEEKFLFPAGFRDIGAFNDSHALNEAGRRGSLARVQEMGRYYVRPQWVDDYNSRRPAMPSEPVITSSGSEIPSSNPVVQQLFALGEKYGWKNPNRLAVVLGISRETLRRWRNDERSPQRSHVKRMLDFFKATKSERQSIWKLYKDPTRKTTSK